jgi:hypothetical protein
MCHAAIRLLTETALEANQTLLQSKKGRVFSLKEEHLFANAFKFLWTDAKLDLNESP